VAPDQEVLLLTCRKSPHVVQKYVFIQTFCDFFHFVFFTIGLLSVYDTSEGRPNLLSLCFARMPSDIGLTLEATRLFDRALQT
jgi:hypothetical protein